MKYEPRSLRMSGSIKICYMINWCCHEFLWDDLWKCIFVFILCCLEFSYGRVVMLSEILGFFFLFSFNFFFKHFSHLPKVTNVNFVWHSWLLYLLYDGYKTTSKKKMLAFWMSDFWCLNYVCKSIMSAKSRKILRSFIFSKMLNCIFLLINSEKKEKYEIM